MKLGDSIVPWKSKKQNTISRGSTEAEYRSILETVAELIWLQGLMKEPGIDIKSPTAIHTDSKSAMQIVYNPVHHVVPLQKKKFSLMKGPHTLK